jgi:D-arabinose 1-dehydrogenase-like Zn-dependent alcohol dehydrogenase
MAHPDRASMASHTVISEFFAHRVPETISLAHAGPLMCAGATVFEAINHYGVLPTERVGIVGIGGLGHLAIQYAAKMGCEVVVFSSTEDKRAEAMSLGATEFYATKGIEKLQLNDNKKINHLLVTTSAPPDFNLSV